MEDLNPLVVAKSLLMADRPNDVLPILLDFVAMHPKSFNAYIFLAAAHCETGNYTVALDCYRHLTEIAPRKIAPYVYSAHILLTQENTTEAVDIIRQGLKLSDGSDPENEAAGKGYIAYLDKDWSAAEQYFLTARRLRDNPSEPYLLSRIAEVQFELKKFDEALHTVEHLHSLRTAKVFDLRLLSLLKRKKGDKTGSYTELQKAIDMDANDKKTLAMMIHFLMRDGKFRNAFKYALLNVELTDRKATNG